MIFSNAAHVIGRFVKYLLLSVHVCVGAIVGNAVGFAEPVTQQSFLFSKQQSINLLLELSVLHVCFPSGIYENPSDT
jgi:hypothetical protein